MAKPKPLKNSTGLSGVWTALVTPFDRKGHVDFATFRKLLKTQREARVSGVIPCGTTGEAPTLSLTEKKDLILCALQELKGSGIRVFAGTGSHSTQATVDLSAWASEAGADGLLVVTPYYNKPSQSGLIAHYRAIADAVRIPILMYQVPSRTGVRFTTETLLALAKHPRIVGLKDSTGDISGVADLAAKLRFEKSPLQILSGDDPLFVPYLSLGAVGIVSVASNAIPEVLVKMHSEWTKGKPGVALDLQLKYQEFFKNLFMEPNPVPLKQCMEWLKQCSADVRLPLTRMTDAGSSEWKNTLKRAGIL